MGVIVAAASAYLFEWWRALYGVIPGLASLLGFAYGLVVLVKMLAGKTKPGMTTADRNLLLVSLFLLAQLAYFPFSSAIYNWEIKRAQSFAEGLIPELEEYKRQHNAYPEDVEALIPLDASLPTLLCLSGTAPFEFDNRSFYRRRGTSYGFQFYVPDGFIGYSYEYCCGAHGKWTITD